MKLTLVRSELGNVCTIGDLHVDGDKFCYTLEDVVRGNADPATVGVWKIKNETAIPNGTYELGLRYSPHLGRIVPVLLNVPGYEYVEIHWGNWAKDTDGCILVGLGKESDMITESKAAFEKLFPLIESAINSGEGATIEICFPSTQ